MSRALPFDRPPAIVLKYYLYEATVTFGFFWPVFTIFLLGRGLNFTEIALLNSLSAAFIVVGEIPTGYLGDRIGRRNSLIVSSVLYTVSVGGFAFARTFLGFVAIWLVWSFAQTFRSGTNEAWLYDVLKDRFDEERYTHVRGRGGAVNMWTSAGTMLVAGVLYGLDPRLPFVAAATLNALGVVVLVTLPQNRIYEDDDEDAFTVREALPVVRESLSVPPVRSFVLYMALFFGVITGVDEFIQPVTVDVLGFPEEVLGPLYAAFTVLGAIGSQYAGRIEDALGVGRTIVLVPLVVGLALVAPLLAPIAVLPVFFVAKVGRAVMSPIASGFVNDRTGSVGRATVLSTVSMAYALFRIPLQPIGGRIADVSGPLFAIVALGGLFLAGFALVHLVESPAGTASADVAVSPQD